MDLCANRIVPNPIISDQYGDHPYLPHYKSPTALSHASNSSGTERSYVDSYEAALTEERKPFHALYAATGKARSPRVERFVGAMTNVSETEERRRQRPSSASTSAVRRRLSARYVGAVL